MPFHAGLDWGGTAHAICVIDGAGRVIARIEVRHDAAGLADMMARLRRIAPAAELPIAIERPSGLIVDSLIEAGHPVIPIHPNVVRACRPRYRAAGGKSDPGDAFMLADILRTDGHRFRRLMPASDDIQALRALVRGRGDLLAHRVALANQLRSLLEGFWPGAAAIFAVIDSPITLAFVSRYPTPDSAARLGQKRLASFMAQNAYCGRRSPAELLARLRAAPIGLAGDTEAEAKGELARALVAVLERLGTEIATLSSRIEHAVSQLPDGRIVMSFPRAGRICAAQILAELGDVRERYPTEDQLAAEVGVCPVTHASAKPRRCLPLGLQRKPASRRHLLCRQLPTRIGLGLQNLQPSPSTRLQAGPRRPYSRSRLGACPLASLAKQQTLRSRPTSRRDHNHNLKTSGWTQGVSWTVEQKREIVAESLGWALTPAEVAQARDQHRTDLDVTQSAAELSPTAAIEPPQFASEELASTPAAETTMPPSRAQGQIEIVLPGGVLVRVDAQVDGRALRRVLAALAEH